MITSVDTNILLDILIPNTPYCLSSKALLDEAQSKGALVINEAVYAELASQFETQEELDLFLADTGIRVETSKKKALFKAGMAWKKYIDTRGDKLMCPECGGTLDIITCPRCRRALRGRQHILNDFLIGSHDCEQADILLTRDRGFYRTYFPDLPIKSYVSDHNCWGK